LDVHLIGELLEIKRMKDSSPRYRTLFVEYGTKKDINV